jgi:hypothetical protein
MSLLGLSKAGYVRTQSLRLLGEARSGWKVDKTYCAESRNDRASGHTLLSFEVLRIGVATSLSSDGREEIVLPLPYVQHITAFHRYSA